MNSRYKGPFKAVILDWAGTTIDFGCMAPVAVLEKIFQEAQVPLERNEARHGMGLLKKDQIRLITNIARIRAAWRAVHGIDPDENEVNRLFEAFLPKQIETLKDHSKLIPGMNEAIQSIRARGLKIGTTTGYTRAMLDAILPLAAEQGYIPDATVCPDEIGKGRPYPYMCFENMRRLEVYPPEACIKVGDTPTDMEEGRNAGMWTIGICATGNEVGLNEEEWNALPAEDQKARAQAAHEILIQAGAHMTINSISEIEEALVKLTN